MTPPASSTWLVLRLALILIIWLGEGIRGIRAQSEGDKARAPLIEARPMSLSELTAEADKIFKGTVLNVESENVELQGKTKRTTVRVSVVTFHVTQKLKGNFDARAPLKVRETSTVYVPVEKGDELLWYLAKPGPSGFTAPLGIYSGHFKIRPAKRPEDVELVVNLLNNRGLWSTESPLINSTKGLEASAFENALKRKSVTLSQARLNRVMAIANEPQRPGPLPLELILTATERLLDDSNR